MYLLALCNSSFEKSLFNSCTNVFIAVLILWGMGLLSSLYTHSGDALKTPLNINLNIKSKRQA
jgi:hypothetical protein